MGDNYFDSCKWGWYFLNYILVWIQRNLYVDCDYYFWPRFFSGNTFNELHLEYTDYYFWLHYQTDKFVKNSTMLIFLVLYIPKKKMVANPWFVMYFQWTILLGILPKLLDQLTRFFAKRSESSWKVV